MRRLEGGERERHLRAMEDATSSPGRTRVTSSGTMDPARSDHGQRHKGQDAALARRKARGVTFHAHPSGAIRTPARSNPGTAPCRRADPLVCEGDGRNGMQATPWPRAETGADFLLTQRNAQSCRVGKGVGRTFNTNSSLSCAVPTNGINASCAIHGGHGAR